MVTAACRSVSWQCCTCTRDELNLDLLMLPWHSMAVVRCQVLLGPRMVFLSIGVSNPSSPKDLSLPPQEPDRTHAFSFLRDVCTDVEPLLCRRLVGPCSLFGLLSPASRSPDSSWDCHRAFHKSPPNELDRHAPSRRGLLDHPSQRSQAWHINTISIVAIRRMSRHHASALGASPGHHRLPSLPAVHCTDHVLLDECEALLSIARRVETIIQRICRTCLHSDNLGFSKCVVARSATMLIKNVVYIREDTIEQPA